MKKIHLENIDVVRGIAIVLVVLYHSLLALHPGFELKNYGNDGVLVFDNWKSLGLNFNFIGQGGIGVELFLIISGFLIHFIYLQNESTFKWSGFYLKRFWRIFPPFLIILTFFWVLKFDFSISSVYHYLAHFFLVHNLFNDTFFSINPSFWSIALEAQLYLIYPLFIFMRSRLGISKTLLILLGFNLLFSSIALFYGITSPAFGTSIPKFWIVWGAGAYLAEKFYNGERVFKNAFLVFIVFFILFCGMKMLYITKYYRLLAAIISCLALTEAILHSSFWNRNLLLRKVFNAFSFIGLISYSVYLIHQPYLKSLIQFFNPNTSISIFNVFVSLALTYGCILLISYLLYRFLELKSVGIGRRILATFQS